MSWAYEQEVVWRARYDCDYSSYNFIWPTDSEWQSYWKHRVWPDTYADWAEKMLAPRSQQRQPREGEKILQDWKWLQEHLWRKKYDHHHGCACITYVWQSYDQWKAYWAYKEWPEVYETWKIKMKPPTRG